MSKSFCLLDNSMTLHGLRFLPEGGDMVRFMDNPILLKQHVRGEVYGKWNNIRLEAGEWRAEPEFDMDDPEAAKLAGKVERGFIKACSLGVVPKEVELIAGEPWATKWEAIEGSIVDAGSNANALKLYSPVGELVEDSLNVIQNLTIPIMSEQKKVIGADNAPVTAVVPVEIALAAGLAPDATPTLVAAKIKELTDRNTALELAAKTTQDKAIKDLLDDAQKAGKINANDLPHYQALAAVNIDSVKAILATVAAPVDLAAFAKSGQVLGNVATDVDLAAEYDKLDKSGKLYALKSNHPEKFKAMFKARFDKEFKE